MHDSYILGPFKQSASGINGQNIDSGQGERAGGRVLKHVVFLSALIIILAIGGLATPANAVVWRCPTPLRV